MIQLDCKTKDRMRKVKTRALLCEKVAKLMGECNTILCVYKMYWHLE